MGIGMNAGMWAHGAANPLLGAHASADQLAAVLQDSKAREELFKALTIGHNLTQPSVAPGVGFPQTLESLEFNLRNATFRAEHLTMWRMIPKMPAFNTREQFNRINSYGQAGISGWVPEAGTPSTVDSEYERAYVDIKYMSVLTEISLVAMLIKPAHGPIAAQEQLAKTMFLLGSLNGAIYYGDSSLDALQFDGLDKQIADNVADDHIFDLRGEPIGEEDLVDGCLVAGAGESFGRVTDIFMGPEVKSDLGKILFPRSRVDQAAVDNQGYYVGGEVNGFKGPFGRVTFREDVFVNPSQGIGLSLLNPQASGVGDATRRPAAPSRTAVDTTPPNAASQFGADDAGDYYYWVAAANAYGISAAVRATDDASTPITVAEGDDVRFGFTPGGSNDPATEYYILYRTKVGGASAASASKIIARIPNDAGAGETTIIDLNATLPGTTSSYGLQFNQDNLAYKQLAPLLGVPFGTQALSMRKALVLFGAPAVYLPKHNFILRNVGRPVGARGLYA